MGSHHGRGGKERYPPGFTVTSQGSLWDNHNAYRLQPLSQDEDALYRQQMYLKKRQYLLSLYHRERVALQEQQAREHQVREHVRRSVDATTPLNQPPRSERGSYFGRHPLGQPPPPPAAAVSPNLWEGIDPLHNPLPPSQMAGVDDPMLSESYSLRHSHLLEDQPPLKPSSARRRTFSMDSDLGGELVSGLQAALDGPRSIGHPGLNRAPGHMASRSGEQQSKEGRSTDERSANEGSGWPTGSSSEATSATDSNWSNPWSMDSPFGPEPRRSLTDDITSRSSSSCLANTYDLFENQSIWSFNDSGNSSLLSWAQVKPEKQQETLQDEQKE